MYLARVIGRVVATRRYEGLEGVALQWLQPLDERGAPEGQALVACATVSSGPGDLVHYVDGREGALACPVTFVPVDAAIVGFVEEAAVPGGDLADLPPGGDLADPPAGGGLAAPPVGRGPAGRRGGGA